MRTASDLIAELNAVDESSTIEAKACSKVGKSVMETVCAYSNEPEAQSRKLKGQSRKAAAQSRKPDASLTTIEMPSELASQVAGLSKRPKERDLRDVITSLCAWKPMTSSELAEHLGRERGALLSDHLRPMVDLGLLSYTIPDMPQHPDQAYAKPSEDSK